MKKSIFIIILLCLLGFTITYQEEITNYVVKKYIYSNKPTYSAPNDYTLNYNFDYVKTTNDYIAKNRKDIINILYTHLNNGDKNFEFYCDYENCSNDVEEIVNSNELIELVNFVHPYNGFRKVHLDINNFDKAEIKIEKAYTEDNIKAINNKIAEIEDKIIKNSMTDREKIKAFHDYLIDNTKYDTEYIESALNDIDNASHKAIGPLFFKKALCSGYSDTMSIFLNRQNIPNYRISSNDHIWNFIYVDNNWYHLDATWDDPVTDSGKDIKLDVFFLITTKELEKLNTGYHDINKNIYLEAR